MPVPTWDVLGVGCNSVDYVYRVPASPRAGTATAKQRISSHASSCGGQTATTVAACAALGLRAAYLGAVGNDENGRRLRDELERRGVDVSLIVTREAPTRFAVITVDEASGDRMVLWDRDARLNLSESEVSSSRIRSARLVHVDDEDQEASIRAARLAREAGIPVTSDIDRLTDRTRELLAAVTVPILSEHLLPELTGEQDPARALRVLRRSHDGLLCVTLGPGGAMLLTGDEIVHEPAFEVKAVDTTAAGDVFRAGFIEGLLRNAPPRELLRGANAAAAIACTRSGAIASVPLYKDVRALLASGDRVIL
jgi:ribokinase/sulfofructose kinase